MDNKNEEAIEVNKSMDDLDDLNEQNSKESRSDRRHYQEEEEEVKKTHSLKLMDEQEENNERSEEDNEQREEDNGNENGNERKRSNSQILRQIKVGPPKKKFSRAPTTLDDKMRISMAKKKHLEKKDLYNREKSKLACLIRKKYTMLMKESIRMKGTKERYYCCASCRKVSSRVIYQLTGTLVQAIISVLAIIIYVVSTYYPDYSLVDTLEEPDKTLVSALKWTELAIAIVINLDWVYNVITSKQRWKYIFNFLNIMDMIIVLSIYLNFIIPSFRSLAFIRVFRVVRIMRVFRFYKIIQSRKKESYEESNEVTRRLISAILTVLAVVFLATGVVHFLNDTFPDYFRIVIPSLDTMGCKSGGNFTVNEFAASREGVASTLACAEGDPIIKVRGKLTFDLAFYYMVITMATVGYGDIYPDTSWMRLVIGIFVIVSIITISKQTSELQDLIKLNSEYQVPYKESKGTRHCVLSGFFSKSSLLKFLNEFYHIDHKESSENMKIVIIQSDYPDKEIQSILLNLKFEENLHYLIGDIFSETTLQMAKVQTASSVFLISDQSHPDAMKNDQFLILACKAISQYTQSPLYVQFNFSQSLLHDWADWDMACSSQQIKMSIIVKNGFISGFSTMIMNLSSSSSSFYNSDIKETPWMLEYIHGASQEIYIVKVPEDKPFERRFAKFVEKAYVSCGSLIIGVKRKVCYQEDKDIFYYIYLLNPIDYEIQAEDELIVISADNDSAKAVFAAERKYKKKGGKTEDGVTAENQKLFDEELMNFQKLIKDENEGIKESLLTQEKDEEEMTTEYKKRLSINQPITAAKKIKLPEIFHKRQHFKIWETNPEEFESELENHYLIFCKEDHLWEFMNCFDQYYSEVIFFVSDQHPSPKWDIVRRYFKNLVFIECSYSDQEDLVKLHLEKAKHVFILTYAVENSNVNDSGILPLVKIIEENFPKCKYTLELSDELNVRYLNNKGVDQEGRTIVESDKGVVGDKKDEKGNKKVARLPVRLWPKYAKSDIFFASALESLLAFSYHNEGLLDVITKILGFGNIIKDKNVEENDFISMFRYVGKDKILYEKIVQNFLKLDPPVIPIAIYRMNSDRELKNESPYIITNPKKDLELNQFDKVICIGKPLEKIFETFKEEDYMMDSESMITSDSEEDENSIEIPDKKKNLKTVVQTKSLQNEDLDLLDEDQLLERLKNEIRNLKMLARHTRSDVSRTHSSNLNMINFAKQTSNFNVIEERNDEHEDIKGTLSDQSESHCDSSKVIVTSPSNRNDTFNSRQSDAENTKQDNKTPQNNIKTENMNVVFSPNHPMNNESSAMSDSSDGEEKVELNSGVVFKKKSTFARDSNANNQLQIEAIQSPNHGGNIINNNNFNIKINTHNQFTRNNLINISPSEPQAPPTFKKLAIIAVEKFDIIDKEDKTGEK